MTLPWSCDLCGEEAESQGRCNFLTRASHVHGPRTEKLGLGAAGKQRQKRDPHDCEVQTTSRGRNEFIDLPPFNILMCGVV